MIGNKTHRLMVLALMALVMLMVVPVAGANPFVSEAGEPEPTGTVEAGIGLVEYLIVVAAVLAILIEQIKPVVFDPLRERLTAQTYLITIYATRTFFGVIAVVVYGGAEQMAAYLPWLATLPDAVVIGTGALLVGIGTEILHPLLDMLYALRNRVDPAKREAQVSREVIVG